MALDFKDFLAVYDPAKGDPYIQYRRQKYRRTDTTSESVESVDEKRGLWDNIHAKRKRGEKPNPPGHPDRPTAQDFKNSQTNEALNLQQRRQRMMQFKRQKARIEVGAERAKKRTASKEVLMKRARRTARNMLLKKMAKVSSKSELDFARREQIEKRLDMMKNKINTLAVKLFPKLRKMDIERKQSKRSEDQQGNK